VKKTPNLATPAATSVAPPH